MARMDDVRAATVVREPDLAHATGAGPADFESFFLAHQLRLFRALWLMTRNRHEAEEVMQDAFLRVWERWDRVAALPDPEGYLYRTAMNAFRSRARRAAVAVRKAVGQLPADDQLAAVESREAVVRAWRRSRPGSARPSSSPTCWT